MKHHSDQTEVLEAKPTQDEVASQAYAIYTKEGKPQGHAEQNWLAAEAELKSGDHYVLFGFASAVFWYGGWPFLMDLVNELKARKPGMMTLVGVAITTGSDVAVETADVIPVRAIRWMWSPSCSSPVPPIAR